MTLLTHHQRTVLRGSPTTPAWSSMLPPWATAFPPSRSAKPQWARWTGAKYRAVVHRIGAAAQPTEHRTDEESSAPARFAAPQSSRSRRKRTRRRIGELEREHIESRRR
jgi:hypothetical protein